MVYVIFKILQVLEEDINPMEHYINFKRTNLFLTSWNLSYRDSTVLYITKLINLFLHYFGLKLLLLSSLVILC